MLLSINKNLIDKADLSKSIANTGFEKVNLERAQLAEVINLGHAFTCQLKGNRCSENFLATGFAALDFDETWPLKDALTDPYIQKHACLIYTTPSHQKGGNDDRFRVVFELPETVYNSNVYRQLIEGLQALYPNADPSGKDPARVWFGSKGSQPSVLTGTLTKAEMDSLIANGSEIQVQKAARRKEYSYELPIEEAVKMLNHIDPQPGYAIWRSICFALGNAYDEEEAITIIEDWSPDDAHRGKHLRQLVRRADGRITLGTVIYYAVKGGYRPPKEFIDRKRTAEQVALQDVFDNGSEYGTIGNSLYQYKDSYYIEIPDPLARQKIAEYFNIYPTGEGQNKYATDTRIKHALGFVKDICQVPSENINPPGINLENGFLRPIYKPNGQVDFELLPHSPERYCTYKAPFNYNPDADPTELKAIMNEMLPADYQEILFRTIGASLDLQEVRKNRHRAVRLLYLFGVGSNGKDTVKEWVCLLYGGHGVTAVPLQVFRAADKDRSFGLAPLVYSRLNWASENAAISIDHCQTLKNFVTGDELNVEEKHKQGFTIRPKAVGIFNINELPHIATTQEAISGRNAILEFPYSFVTSPKRQNEKKANPRIKGDPNFIRETILPALLNRIIKGFKDTLREGIDYTSIEPLMQAVREENSHLLHFIEEAKLVECPNSEGITASDIYFCYQDWCRRNGLIDASTGRPNDPSPFDKVMTSPTQVKKRLQKLFPHLDSKRDSSRGRVLNLKFNKAEVF